MECLIVETPVNMSPIVWTSGSWLLFGMSWLKLAQLCLWSHVQRWPNARLPWALINVNNILSYLWPYLYRSLGVSRSFGTRRLSYSWLQRNWACKKSQTHGPSQVCIVKNYCWMLQILGLISVHERKLLGGRSQLDPWWTNKHEQPCTALHLCCTGGFRLKTRLFAELWLHDKIRTGVLLFPTREILFTMGFGEDSWLTQHLLKLVYMNLSWIV